MGKLRVAATADLHYGKHSRGVMHDAFAEISRRADVLLLCGDMTDYGLAEEAEELVADLHSGLRIPALAVLGNHDLESGNNGARQFFYQSATWTVLARAAPRDRSPPERIV